MELYKLKLDKKIEDLNEKELRKIVAFKKDPRYVMLNQEGLQIVEKANERLQKFLNDQMMKCWRNN